VEVLRMHFNHIVGNFFFNIWNVVKKELINFYRKNDAKISKNQKFPFTSIIIEISIVEVTEISIVEVTEISIVEVTEISIVENIIVKVIEISSIVEVIVKVTEISIFKVIVIIIKVIKEIEKEN